MVREISKDATLRGKVIPLSFHVDYWNHLGWRDAFSSPEWSARQAGYTRSLALAGAYTPQMVVDGRRQFVGSNRQALDQAVAEESRAPAFGSATVTVSRHDAELVAGVSANVSASSPTDVVLVVFEDGLSTRIASGERGGSTVLEDGVVRTLRNIATLTKSSTSKSISIPIDRTWNPARLGVAVFLQDQKTLAIHGAALARPH